MPDQAEPTWWEVLLIFACTVTALALGAAGVL